MNFKAMNNFLNQIGDLKHLLRTGWVIRGIEMPESVAGHQYRMAIIAMLVFDPDEEKNIDLDKVIKLALIHDMGEVIVGDISPYDPISQEDKHKQEMDAMLSLSKLLPPKNADRLISLFKEYEERETNESKLTKELDVFDAVMQAYEYEKKDVQKRNGELVVDMQHFYDKNYLNKIQHPKLRSLLNQMLNERDQFLSKINNNVIEFKPDMVTDLNKSELKSNSN